ncbi:MAG: threonine--tRNA ligase [Candidatus Woesearchaeota archaeon]
MIEIKFPDGNMKKYEKGISIAEILKELPQRIQQEALAAKITYKSSDKSKIIDSKTGESKEKTESKVVDIATKIERNVTLQILTFNDKEGKDVFWHSASHLMSQAILRVFKGKNIGLGVGVAVENGFYQDYGMEPLHPDDLEKIEAEMKKIVNEKLQITQKIISKKEAKEFYKNDPYKTELINGVEGDEVSMYCQGEYENLCKGPHIPNTRMIKAFKLMKIAGAYWRGDAKKDQLQRIYGIAFRDKKDLKEYIHILEEAKKRDHREIGKRLDLFSFHEEGPGFPFFHAKGMVIWDELINFWKDVHRKDGYVEFKTPTMLSRKLWETSGHWFNYKENMYTTFIDNMDYAIKPMNCPGGFLIYKERVHSYREFPLKAGEIGHVHRHELSGVLAGLFRVRAFHQDDAHIFMTPDQIKEQILGVIRLSDLIYSKFGLGYNLELSTRPEKSVGTDEQWEKATKGLKDALDETGKKYKINEGDGAFYGPKIDFHIKDCLGRTWQCGTIQLDMAMPDRFDMTYDDKDGKKHRPVMIHRTIYGSLERFLGILIEHFAGKFPLWLSPMQVRILTVADRFNDYAEKVKKIFYDMGIRVEIDSRTEGISKKVRDAQVQYIPLILTVGEKEEADNTVAVRTLSGEVKFGVNTEDFAKKVKENIDKRELEFKL